VGDNIHYTNKIVAGLNETRLRRSKANGYNLFSWCKLRGGSELFTTIQMDFTTAFPQKK
jgi:hypothetical protein